MKFLNKQLLTGVYSVEILQNPLFVIYPEHSARITFFDLGYVPSFVIDILYLVNVTIATFGYGPENRIFI